MRQLSADSITPTHIMAETSTPSGSHHVIPPAQKPPNESAKRSLHSQQMGNLVGDINALALDNNSSSQPKTGTGNQNIGASSSNTNTNGTAALQKTTNRQATTPNVVNCNAKNVSTENSTGRCDQAFFSIGNPFSQIFDLISFGNVS